MAEKALLEEEIGIDPESEFFENLAEGLSEEELDRIGNELIDGFENDLDSMKILNDTRKEYNRLFDLESEAKNYPLKNSSNVKLPVITTACINFQARASINLFSPGNIVKGLPLDGSDDSFERARRVARHMNWQLMFNMPNFYEGWDKTLMQLPKDGYAFRKSFWNSEEKRVESDYILSEDFVINYYTKTLEESYRYTQVLHLNENQIKLRQEQGIFIDTEDLPEVVNESESVNDVTRESKQHVGETIPESDYTEPRDILEMHTFITLKEDDDLRRPFVVTIDRESKKVLRIIRRQNPQSKDTLTYFTAYAFLPNPSSIFGYGFGKLLKDMTNSMNTSINQLTDAAHLSILRGGWLKKGSTLKRGLVEFKMGQFQELDARVDDIRKAVMPLEFAPPSPVMLSLIEYMQGQIDKLTTVTEIFSGGQPRSDTTATGQQLAVEQGAKVFTGIQQRIHRAFQKELQKIRILNGIFLNETEFIDIVTEDDDFEKQGTVIAREDYLKPLSIMPVSDPNIISDQQIIAKAEHLFKVIQENPFLAQNPEALRIVTKRRLESVNETEGVIKKLDALQKQTEQQVQEQQQMEQAQGQIAEIDQQISQEQAAVDQGIKELERDAQK